MRLRPYQEQCLRAIRETLVDNRSTLAVLATGLGKTVVFAHAVADWPGRCLVVAHRDELIRQAADKIEAVTGDRPGIEMGADFSHEDSFIRPRIVVTSVQTMCRPKRQQRFRPDDFGLIVIDEAHHATSASYQGVIRYFTQAPGCRVLGVTATPKRGDNIAMGAVFKTVALEYGIEPAINDGWLVPVTQQSVQVKSLDFSKVKTLCGDFKEGELDRILSEEKILHETAAPTADIIGDRSTLVFCVSVGHAHTLAAVLSRYKGLKDKVVALDGTTDRGVRKDQIEAFKAGKVQVLCNCGLFLEGFDAPNTAAVVMARPTKSLALYTQVLGRGTRPLPGVVDGTGLETAESRREAIAASSKPSMLILDFVGNSGQHKIINATDLLGGDYPDDVREYAKKTAEQEGGAVEVQKALGRAKDEKGLLDEVAAELKAAELELRRAELDRRRAEIRARAAQYELREVSPFAAGECGPEFTQDGAPKREGDPPTEKQIWFLVKRGGFSWEAARNLSKRQASAVIGKLKAEGAA